MVTSPISNGVAVLTNVTRHGHGVYSCVANNDVGPLVTKTIELTVLCEYFTMQVVVIVIPSIFVVHLRISFKNRGFHHERYDTQCVAV